MPAPGNFDDLTPAVQLILHPLLLEVLVAIDDGEAVVNQLPIDADTALRTAAVHRLETIGAVRHSTDCPFGRHQLTARGRELLRLLESLNAVMTTPEPVGHDWPRLAEHCQETEGSSR